MRWGTADGCVPFKVIWVYFRAIEIFRARTALDLQRGINLAFSDGPALQTAHEDAFPELDQPE